MRLARKNKVAVLKYKLVFEELEQAEYEFDQGRRNLSGHLAYFRDKLMSEKSSQLKNFDQLFFAPESSSAASESAGYDLDKVDQEEERKRADSHPPWAKKLYRKIVGSTHPDKTAQIKIDSLEEKLNNMYMLAVESHKSGEYQNLIMIAVDLDIDFSPDLIDAEVVPSTKRLHKKLVSVTSSIEYLWHHIPEEEKMKSLKEHLTKMGFVFTDNEVKEAIRKVREKNMRKAGARPVKNRRMRLK